VVVVAGGGETVCPVHGQVCPMQVRVHSAQRVVCGSSRCRKAKWSCGAVRAVVRRGGAVQAAGRPLRGVVVAAQPRAGTRRGAGVQWWCACVQWVAVVRGQCSA